jgi:hypothetical protein
MISPNFDLLATNQLTKRKQLSNFALYLVWAGASFAVLASIYTFSSTGIFPAETFITALLAFAASIPVFLERKKINQVLVQRNQA